VEKKLTRIPLVTASEQGRAQPENRWTTNTQKVQHARTHTSVCVCVWGTKDNRSPSSCGVRTGKQTHAHQRVRVQGLSVLCGLESPLKEGIREGENPVFGPAAVKPGDEGGVLPSPPPYPRVDDPCSASRIAWECCPNMGGTIHPKLNMQRETDSVQRTVRER